MDDGSEASRKPRSPEATSQNIDWDSTRLKLALAAGEVAFWSWDLVSGEIIWGGHRFGLLDPERGSGLDGDEVFLQLIHPNDREHVARQLVPTIERGEPLKTEFRVVGLSGQVHWLAAYGHPECDESGRPIHLIGVARDVTERKKAEEALRQSEERLRRILDQSPDIIFRVGRNGLEYISPACWQILGFRPEEKYAESSLLPGHVHPDDHAKVPEIVHQLHHGPVRCELRILHADGRTIWTEHALNPIFTPSGKLFAVEGIVRDISERKCAEDALEKQRKEQRVIFDSVPAMIWYKDRHNRILQANVAAAQSMGMTVDDLAGRSTHDLYPDEADQYHRDDLEVINSGHPKLGIVELLQTVSGEKRWVRTDKIPYRDENNEIIGVIAFAIDVTERVTAERALRRAHDDLEVRVRERTAELAAAVEGLRLEIAQREKAEEKVRRQQEQLAHVQRLRTIEGVASQLAHEINQPLAAIVNFANGIVARLRSGGIDTETMGAAATQIREQAMRAGEVIRRLRGFVRKETARREYAAVNDLVQEAAQLIEPEAQRNGICIRFCLDADAGLPPIQVDRVQIEQVVVNLLRNGIDAIVETGSREGELLVTTKLMADGIQVSICDNGAGLPAGAEAQLFEPYFTTKSEGLGMGLSISRSITEAHGGALWAESNEKKGMTFLLRLPVPVSATANASHEQKVVG